MDDTETDTLEDRHHNHNAAAASTHNRHRDEGQQQQDETAVDTSSAIMHHETAINEEQEPRHPSMSYPNQAVAATACEKQDPLKLRFWRTRRPWRHQRRGELVKKTTANAPEVEESKEEIMAHDIVSIIPEEAYGQPGAYAATRGGTITRNRSMPFSMVRRVEANAGTTRDVVRPHQILASAQQPQQPQPPQTAPTLDAVAHHDTMNLVVANPVRDDEAPRLAPGSRD